MSDPFDAALDLLRRLPPTKIEQNVNRLCDLSPEYADDLLANVDQPLTILRDESSQKDFLGCDYNRDGDSFRSPWSNEYLPTATSGPVPSAKLRQLEVPLNSAFDTYREMYFEGGISSVYLWDLEDDTSAGGKEFAFAGAVVLKKGKSSDSHSRYNTTVLWCNPGRRLIPVLPPQETKETETPLANGTWDSLHVFECAERGRSAKYKITSTVMLMLNSGTRAKPEIKGLGEEVKGSGDVTLSGSMTRQHEYDYALASSAGHVQNIGRMVEEMENKMRNMLSSIYFGKTRDVTNELRSQSGLEAKSVEDQFRAELAGRLGGRK